MSRSEVPIQPLVSRRATLRAGVLGAAVAWTVPVVQVISMDSASAASGAPRVGGQGDNNQGDNNNYQGGGGRSRP
jgi:hypothetical protein